LHSGGRLQQATWGPEEEWLILLTGLGLAPRDVLTVRPGVDSVATPLLATSWDHRAIASSPNGPYIAYVSNESGTNEVLVRPFRDVEADRLSISTDGGIMPVWSHGGDELFYVDRRRRLIAVQLGFAPTLSVVQRDTLFTLPPEFHTSPDWATYGIAPDDHRFLMARFADGQGGPAPRTGLVLNWFERLKELLPN